MKKTVEIFTNWKKALADMINNINNKGKLTINNYEYKLGTLEDMNTKWGYEINDHPGNVSQITCKKIIQSFNKSNRVSYCVFIDSKIKCDYI